MKKLFTMIRQGNLEEVAKILDKKPALIACTATAPPKKDHGQSPLMVAIKSDNPEVANLLLDREADVNFKDQPNPYDPYGQSAPIWLDAVSQCIASAVRIVSVDFDEEKHNESVERAKIWFALLRRMLEMGLDPNQKMEKGHYYGGAPRNAWQATLDEYSKLSRVTLPDPNDRPGSYEHNMSDNARLREMTRAVLDLFLEYHVDIHDFAVEEGEETGILLRNLSKGRELLEDLPGMAEDPGELCQVEYQGKLVTINPQENLTRRGRYEVRWREFEPVLRAYYQKS